MEKKTDTTQVLAFAKPSVQVSALDIQNTSKQRLCAMTNPSRFHSQVLVVHALKLQSEPRVLRWPSPSSTAEKFPRLCYDDPKMQTAANASI
ncbi:hypothetical protein SRHO_G00206300 [Serrasalmus rhombeus]